MVEEKVEEYFSSLNFIYRGIMREKSTFESLLGSQWNNLPSEEQDSLLNEHFIPPHIRSKYDETQSNGVTTTTTSVESGIEVYPRLKIKSGQKIIEDDEGELWQDEHSGPFSWETSSQREFAFSDDMASNEVVKTRAKDPKRPKSPRVIRTQSGGEIPRPGSLERTGSTDFQQLRHIWESHHTVTPDSEVLPPFRSKSQLSLNGDSSLSKNISTSSHSTSAECAVEGDCVSPEAVSVITHEVTTTRPDEITDSPSSNQIKDVGNSNPIRAPDLDPVGESNGLTGSSCHTDITDSANTVQQGDVLEMSDMQRVPMKPSDTQQNSIKVSNTQHGPGEVSRIQHGTGKTCDSDIPATAGASVGLKPRNLTGDDTEDDILKRFGVKFSYGEEEPLPTSNSEILATAAFGSKKPNSEETILDEKPTLSSQFDFLTSW